MREKTGRILYWILLAVVFFPFGAIGMHDYISAPVGLALGLAFALLFGTPWPKVNRVLSKWLLQASVVGLGFGMDLLKSLQSGAEGMIFTVVSVAGVMMAGVIAGRVMRVNSKTSYLISAGTAICGGSAIAAVGPIVKADKDEMAVSLGVIFILNAIALFIFPPLGRVFDMTQEQFGMWAAIAIHDTSSVVGAGAAYGAEACDIATLIKCTRALWIIPLALFTMWYYPKMKSRRDMVAGEDGAVAARRKKSISIPWFIFFFVLAMVVNTYTRESAPWVPEVYDAIYGVARKSLVAVLFAIGAGLSLKVIKSVGLKPLLQAVLLWILIGAVSLAVVLNS